MKRLLLDCETAPNLAAVWGMFKQNVSLDMLIESGYTLCWAAKWYGEDHVYFDSVYRNTPEQMVRNVHALLDEADAVIHYNGRKFDIPTINKEFLQYGLRPPSPYKQIDLLETARKKFRFTSNKLDYVAKFLGIGAKQKHRGYELWRGCMNGDDDCWKEMEEYNIQDTILLESLYDRLLPWIDRHPNLSVYDLGEAKCTHCGSTHLQRRGYAHTSIGIYQRWQCNDCGSWLRTRTQEKQFDRSGVLTREM